MEIQRAPGGQLRIPPRADGRSAEADLVLLSDLLAEQERQISEQIEVKIAQHQQWNQGYVDMTKAPLTPLLEMGTGSTFRTATTEYLPTPPASVASEHSGDNACDNGSANLEKPDSVAVRYASPSYDGPRHTQTSFRRRYGRGGRLWIDRRGMRLPSKQAVSPVLNDFKFDDDDEEEEVHIYFHDPYDAESMQFRSRIFPTQPTQAQMLARRAQMEAQAAMSVKSHRPSVPD